MIKGPHSPLRRFVDVCHEDIDMPRTVIELPWANGAEVMACVAARAIGDESGGIDDFIGKTCSACAKPEG